MKKILKNERILENKENLNNMNGITLVALIITVILMLILAGVAISAVIDSDGLFSKSREATEAYENSAKDENKTISNLMNYIERYISGTPTSSDDKKEEINDTIAPTIAEIASSNVSATAFTLIANGKDDIGIQKYEFYVDDKLEKTVTSNEESITYDVTGKTLGTTYTYKVKVYDKVGNYKESEEIKVTSTEIFDSNKTATGATSGTYNNPIIPKGFAPISENGANWGTTTGYQSGLVITDAINEDTGKSIGNEFVWVPVPGNQDGSNITFERVEWKDASGNFLTYAGTFSEYQETETTSPGITIVTQSVSKNGGFYIARYETGKGNVVKKDVDVYNNIEWSMAKSQAEAKYISTDSRYGIVSTLIYGTQWDTTLKFIMAYDEENLYQNFTVNSIGFGNYNGTNGGDTSIATPASTGSLDAFRQKNIYDMAGNIWEFTMESYNATPVYRGGGYNIVNHNNTASFRRGVAAIADDIGFRISLYIK